MAYKMASPYIVHLVFIITKNHQPFLYRKDNYQHYKKNGVQFTNLNHYGTLKVK
jgi:hypothetical protein